MRRLFTEVEETAMAAAAALLVEAGYRPNGRTVSRRKQGQDVGGGALKFKWGAVERATVGPRSTYFCKVEDGGEIYEERWIRTQDVTALAEELRRRGAGQGLPAPVRDRIASAWGGKYYREGYAKRTTDRG